MVVLGTDAHKRSHTEVAADDTGVEVGSITVAATREGHLRLAHWTARFGMEQRWAIEDCRALSRRLEADLLATGEMVVRVPTLQSGGRLSGSLLCSPVAYQLVTPVKEPCSSRTSRCIPEASGDRRRCLPTMTTDTEEGCFSEVASVRSGKETTERTVDHTE